MGINWTALGCIYVTWREARKRWDMVGGGGVKVLVLMYGRG